MPPPTDAELRAAFLDLYDSLRYFVAGHSTEQHLRIALQRQEALWRRIKTEKPPTSRGKDSRPIDAVQERGGRDEGVATHPH